MRFFEHPVADGPAVPVDDQPAQNRPNNGPKSAAIGKQMILIGRLKGPYRLAASDPNGDSAGVGVVWRGIGSTGGLVSSMWSGLDFAVVSHACADCHYPLGIGCLADSGPDPEGNLLFIIIFALSEAGSWLRPPQSGCRDQNETNSAREVPSGARCRPFTGLDRILFLVCENCTWVFHTWRARPGFLVGVCEG